MNAPFLPARELEQGKPVLLTEDAQPQRKGLPPSPCSGTGLALGEGQVAKGRAGGGGSSLSSLAEEGAQSPGLKRTIARRHPNSVLSICMSRIFDTSSVNTLQGPREEKKWRELPLL